MGYLSDVYSSPEKHGLSVVSEIELSGESYQFDILMVWKHDDGRVFWGQNAGCSCPSPFEDYGSIEDLTLLTSVSEIENIVREARYPEEIVKKEFLSRVSEALGQKK